MGYPTSKEIVSKNLKNAINNLVKRYQEEKHTPTDREMGEICTLFHERDKSGPADTESMAVSRGINVGMILMRQIIEGNYSE